jgi:hypothetical protein
VGVALQLAVTEDREELLSSLPAQELAEREREPVPFHVIINPEITLLGDDRADFHEGCLINALPSSASFLRCVMPCRSQQRSVVWCCLDFEYARILLLYRNPKFSIDLLATREGETVVVEVKKSSSEKPHPTLTALAEAVSRLPNYRFDFVALPVRPVSPTTESLTSDELLTLANQAVELRENNLPKLQ